MKVQIRKTNGDFFIFGDATEISKSEDYISVKVDGAARYFESETILELKVDGKDISL